MKEIAVHSKYGDFVVQMDDEDYQWILKVGNIHINDTGYAMIFVRGAKPYRKERVARLIVERHSGLDKTEYVDHINGNRLDNRKENLRKCTFKQNLFNRRKSLKHSAKTPYKGIRQIKGKWYARIKIEGKEKALGGYATQEEAARAYDTAALLYFGEFACVNFGR